LEIYQDFYGFLNEITDSYGEKNTEIITSIICSHINNFITKFKEYILYVLRYIKDAQDKFSKGENPVLDISAFGFNNALDRDMMVKITHIFNTKENNILDKVITVIADRYFYELSIIALKHKISPIEFLYIVVSDADRYKWCNKFIEMIQ
jgi:hypothetical protein